MFANYKNQSCLMQNLTWLFVLISSYSKSFTISYLYLKLGCSGMQPFRRWLAAVAVIAADIRTMYLHTYYSYHWSHHSSLWRLLPVQIYNISTKYLTSYCTCPSTCHVPKSIMWHMIVCACLGVGRQLGLTAFWPWIRLSPSLIICMNVRSTVH